MFLISGGRLVVGLPIASIASFGIDQRGRCFPLLVLIASGLNFPSEIISRIARSLVLSFTAASRTLLVFGGFMSVLFLASCRSGFHYVGLL
jgi:hypothetical protein